MRKEILAEVFALPFEKIAQVAKYRKISENGVFALEYVVNKNGAEYQHNDASHPAHDHDNPIE